MRVDGDYDEAVRRAAAFAAAEQPRRALVQDTARDGCTEVPERIVQGYGTLLHEVDDELAASGAAADTVAGPVPADGQAKSAPP